METSSGYGLDLDLARHVQQLLFPKSSPVCDWCCVGVKNRMAAGLGGDYYEFITMPDECQAIFVGDITGHGVHASLVMALLYGFIHHTTIKGCAPLELVSQVNSFLRSFAKRSKEYDHLFSTTLFYSIIDPDSLVMHYVNAGHVAPLVRRDNRISYLTPTAHPLGFFDQPEMEIRAFRFEKGDRFLLYTDGITEAFNGRGEAFGRDRLEQVLLTHEGDHLEFLDRIFESLEEFGASNPPEDDCTAIVLDFHGL